MMQGHPWGFTSLEKLELVVYVIIYLIEKNVKTSKQSRHTGKTNPISICSVRARMLAENEYRKLWLETNVTTTQFTYSILPFSYVICIKPDDFFLS